MKYVGFIVTFVALVFLRGFALQQLWGWFIIPFGLPALSIAWALGVSQVLSLFVGDFKREDSESISDMFVRAFAAPIGALIFGFVIHLFM